MFVNALQNDFFRAMHNANLEAVLCSGQPPQAWIHSRRHPCI